MAEKLQKGFQESRHLGQYPRGEQKPVSKTGGMNVCMCVGVKPKQKREEK